MKFRHMQPKDYQYYKPFFKNQQYDLCEYSLSSIIAWSNEAYQPLGAVKDNFLIVMVRFCNNNSRNHLILPICPTGEFNPEELFDLTNEVGIKSICHIPQSYLTRHALPEIEKFFLISEQPDYHDYVFLTEDLAFLKGNKYSKKRNLINQFKRNYLIENRVKIEPITLDVVDECLEFLDEWCLERNCDAGGKEDDLACEKIAAINTLQNISLLEVKGLLLRIDEVPMAFGIAAHLTDQMATLQYEKAFARVKGLYQYFDSQCAKRLFKNYKYINKESDMGVEGIQKAKKSYYPIRASKSYKFLVK